MRHILAWTAIVIATASIPPAHAQDARAASNLQAIVERDFECATPGKPVARLSWTPAVIQGTGQRVEISNFPNGQPVDSETVSSEDSSLVFDRLRGQAIHFWRVVTIHSDGEVVSEVAQFTGPVCPADIAVQPSPEPPPIK